MHSQQINVPPVSLTISSTKRLNVHFSKLAATDAGVSQLLQLANMHALPPEITIFTDSLGALQALQKPEQQSSQSVDCNITYNTHKIETLPSKTYEIQLQWCPGHSKVIENEMAHYLATQSTEIGKDIQVDRTVSPLL